MNVKSVNKKWIFRNDDTREKATEPKLRAIMEAAAADKIFYSRMSFELKSMHSKAEINLKFGAPSPDRDNYFERVGAISGMSDAIKETEEKQFQAIKLETQCRIALGMEQPNMAQMYPEIIIEKRF